MAEDQGKSKARTTVHRFVEPDGLLPDGQIFKVLVGHEMGISGVGFQISFQMPSDIAVAWRRIPASLGPMEWLPANAPLAHIENGQIEQLENKRLFPHPKMILPDPGPSDYDNEGSRIKVGKS